MPSTIRTTQAASPDSGTQGGGTTPRLWGRFRRRPGGAARRRSAGQGPGIGGRARGTAPSGSGAGAES